VTSAAIGDLVMERLRRLDEVAYVRFASEHRRFRDVESLAEEIETLKARKRREDEARDQVPLITLPDARRGR
jgi:transcriptional repressor NrdR